MSQKKMVSSSGMISHAPLQEEDLVVDKMSLLILGGGSTRESVQYIILNVNFIRRGNYQCYLLLCIGGLLVLVWLGIQHQQFCQRSLWKILSQSNNFLFGGSYMASIVAISAASSLSLFVGLLRLLSIKKKETTRTSPNSLAIKLPKLLASSSSSSTTTLCRGL